jgi:hypothetical protein
MAASLAGSVLALPIGLPLPLPCARALAMPAAMLTWIMERSNSANTPSIWNTALPARVRLIV